MSRQNLEKVEIPSIDQVKTELAEIENRRKYIGALRSTIYVLIVVAAVAVLISTLVFPVPVDLLGKLLVHRVLSASGTLSTPCRRHMS